MIVCLFFEMSSENICLCISMLQLRNAFPSKLSYFFSGFVGTFVKNVVTLHMKDSARCHTEMKPLPKFLLNKASPL